MKYFMFVIFFLFSLVFKCFAESDSLVIKIKDGSVYKIAVSQIQMIKFENITGVDEQAKLTKNLEIKGNYPNPFGELTNIEFEIANNGNVVISIYDNKGNQIQNLICDNCHAGKNSLLWNCIDKNNNKVQSGVYYYEIQFNNEIQSKKMLLIK